MEAELGMQGNLGVNHEEVDRDNILGGIVGSPVTLA